MITGQMLTATKAKKNNNNRTQYRQRDHHEAIVSRDVYEAANLLRTARTSSRQNKPMPVLRVVDQGILRGFVPVDKDWKGFSVEDYQAATQSVPAEYTEESEKPEQKQWNLPDYQVVRGSFFTSISDPALTISAGRMRFNTACLKKFEDVEYVELLLNTVRNCIAIRPCERSNPNAIHWGRLKEERWMVRSIGCRGLAKTLFDITAWDEDAKYRFRGQYLESNGDKLLLFELAEPLMIKIETEAAVPDEEKNVGKPRTKSIKVYPESWLTTFGDPVTVVSASVFEQVCYADEWDVLRPAVEFEEKNIISEDQLAALMREAEELMEGWATTDE